MDLWSIEKSFFSHSDDQILIAGIDEAGRGPIAGPVVAAAVVSSQCVDIEGVTDSKKLTSKRRKELIDLIKNHSDLYYSVGICSHKEIDELNILQASLLSFKKAVSGLKEPPSVCLVDGNKKSPYLEIEQHPIIKGDSKSFLIAAASIIAKETRDQIMVEMHHKWPEYDFQKHKGYPTKAHLKALEIHGPCPIHRQSFAPVKNCLTPPLELELEWN